MPLEDLQKYVAGLTPITAKDMNTLGKVVEMVRGIAGDDFYVDAGGVVRRKAPGKRETRTVRLTSLAGSGYEWKEVAPKADGTFVDVSGGLLSSDMGQAIDPTGDNAFTADTSTGDVVTIRRDVDPDTGDTLWVIIAGGSPPGTLIAVSLSSDGGAIGTQTTASTWTYTATDINGTSLGSMLSPLVARPNGRLNAASYGQGYYNSSGTFVLQYAFEVEGTGGCA